ncbi:MAG: flagellar export chaperone FliS [Novosphingobium sp.]
MLHHRRDPSEAYRRVDFDARVRGADSRQLVDLCLEQVIGSVGRAIHAQERGDNAAKSAALTRAISALTALQMGVDMANPTAGALVQLYQSARNAILDCVTRFDARTLQTIRQDFSEIREAMLRSIPA